MKSRKGFALIISLVLVIGIVLPGTLALSTDQAATNGELTVTEEIPTPTPEVTETPTPTPEVTETPTPTEEPKPTETPGPSETEKPAETEAPKECTCSAAEGEAHKEGCPLYVAPEQPAEAEKTCTCDPAPAEGEAHKEGCPLYVAPEKPADPSHIDTCSDDCTDAECKCPCHLFNKIMACTTLDDIWAIMDHMTDEQWDALSEAQMDAIDQLIARLDMQMVPVQPEADNKPQIESEIIYPTVTYTYVAPFGDPVTGGYR